MATLELIFGKLGWFLLVGWGAISVAFYLLAPSILGVAGLSFGAKFGPTVRNWMLVTLSLWVSQTVVSISRGITWILAAIGYLQGPQYTAALHDSKTIQIMAVWALGIATAFTGYLALWFS